MPIAMKEEDAVKRNNSAMSLKKLVPKVLRSNSMKNLFKSKKPRAPAEIVRDLRRLLSYVDSDSDDGSPRRNDKVDFFPLFFSDAAIHRSDLVLAYIRYGAFRLQLAHLDADIRELKSILYGIEESEPVAEACAQVTQEFFTDDTMRLLILCLPKINFEVTHFSRHTSLLLGGVSFLMVGVDMFSL